MGAAEAPSGPRYGRPPGYFGPSTALLSPELALLKYDLEHLDAFEPDSTGDNFTLSLMKNITKPLDMDATSYLVAYPHPTIHWADHLNLVDCGPETTGKAFLELLIDLYPDHTDDLSGATIQKASPPPVPQLPP